MKGSWDGCGGGEERWGWRESEDGKDGRGWCSLQPWRRASRGKWANQTRTQPVNATGPLYHPSESLRVLASPCEPLRSLANHKCPPPQFRDENLRLNAPSACSLSCLRPLSERQWLIFCDLREPAHAHHPPHRLQKK